MESKLPLIPKMQFAFGGVLVVLLTVGVVSYRSLLASSETDRWIQHTHEVLEHLENLTSTIADLEAGYRGFVLSGAGAFLRSSRADLSLLDQEEKTLRILTADKSRSTASTRYPRRLARTDRPTR